MSSRNKYFQDELTYLRELGTAFAEKNPSLAKMLSEEGDDPDVERLFEGFAFLTGRIRQKIEDEQPELSHSLIELLWPNYLRPVPAMSILSFTPRLHILSEQNIIPKGSTVQSAEVDGTPCIFRTCYDVDVAPYSLNSVETIDKPGSTQLTLKFSYEAGISSESVGISKIRLFLHDEQKAPVANIIYLYLLRYLDSIDVTTYTKEGKEYKYTGLPSSLIHPVGFYDNESLLPYSGNIFSGYRLIQEFFQLQDKFLFLDVTGMSDYLSQPDIESFSIRFNISKLLTFSIQKANFKLFCTPIVNLFAHDGSPIRLDHKRIEYLLRPDYKQQNHIDIFSVDRVEGKVKGQAAPNTYTAYETFQHHDVNLEGVSSCFYKLRKAPATLHDGIDHYLYLQKRESTGNTEAEEVISSTLTCTNRNLPNALQVGQIAYDTGTSPDIVTFKNITRTTAALPPPFEHSLHWRLISHLALQYKSLGTAKALKLLIKYYDFAALENRQKQRTNLQMSEGIEKIETLNTNRIIKGVPVSGLKTILHLRESKFGAKGMVGEANMFIFASILSRFFTQYVRTNSFHLTEVIAVESGEHYIWDHVQGQRPQF